MSQVNRDAAVVEDGEALELMLKRQGFIAVLDQLANLCELNAKDAAEGSPVPYDVLLWSRRAKALEELCDRRDLNVRED